MPAKLAKTKFNSGELSPLIDGGTDLSKYYNGCSKLANGTVLPYGGIVKRSGTEFKGVAKTKCKLLEFEFSADDSVIIEMGNLYARFYQDDDRIYEAAVAITSIDDATDIVTITGHSFVDGDWLRCTATGVTAINGKVLVVDNAGVNTFTLTDTNGTAIDIDAGFVAGTVERVYEIVTPYTSTEVFDIHYTQSADVIFMAHPDHPQQKLSRLGIATPSWTIADSVFTGGPWLDGNTNSAYTLKFTRTGGTAAANGYFPAGATGTLEATGYTPFLGTALDIGTKWRLQTTRTDNVTSTPDNSTNVAPTTLTNAVLTFGDFTFVITGFATGETGKLWRKEGNGEWQEYRTFNAATSFSATELFKDVYYAWSRGGGTPASTGTFTARDQVNNGIVKVTAAVDTNTATVIVVDAVQQDGATADSPDTPMWNEGAWGAYRGYPVSVTFFENRLWWGGTTNNPQTLWGSVIGDYENHKPGTLADDAVNFTIQDNNMSAIEWIAARRTLVAGTANKEYSLRANNVDNPIKPDDIKASPQSTNGSTGLQPAALNDGLFYVQRSGRKVFIMRFSFADEEYESRDATLLAEHLLQSAPCDMAVQGVPDPILWVIRDDGVLLSFTYQPEEDVFAWARHITGTMTTSILNGKADPDALFESVAVIAGSIEDEVWFSVQRYINGNTERYIEKFSTRFFDQIDEAQMLDSAVTNLTGAVSGDLILASDTIRFGEGTFGSSYFGGTV